MTLCTHGACRATTACLLALIVLCLAWELWLAPLRPGGSWLALKVLPLAAMVPGIWRGRIYTFQWSSMLILAYFAEGVVRGYADRGSSALLAHAETALALIFFVGAIAYVRSQRQTQRPQPLKGSDLG